MAYMRKRPSATMRRRYRRRRPAVRRIPRVPRSLRLNAISFKRKTWVGNWQPSTASTVDFWKYYSFSLNAMTAYQDVTNMFDEYRIAGLKVEFHPRFNGFAGNDTTDVTLPGITNQSGTKLHILVDPSSTLTPSGTYTSSTLNLLLENGNVRTYSGNRVVSVYYKPKVFNTVSGLAANMIRSPWIRTDQVALPHYGFHAFSQDNNFSGTFGQSWDVFVTYYVQCRDIK